LGGEQRHSLLVGGASAITASVWHDQADGRGT